MTNKNYSVSSLTDLFKPQSDDGSPQYQNNKEIAILNDRFRFAMGLVLINNLRRQTPKLNLSMGVQCLPPLTIALVGKAICEFDNFTKSNDPYKEHDFGKIVVESHKIFWKIDYYDLSMDYQSPDHSDPLVTNRIMSVMLFDEY